jgi:hypothetical protein
MFFSFNYLFCLIVVWGGPIPMAIMTGGVESSGRKSGRPGKLFGGNFWWELFGKTPKAKCRMTNN